MKEKIQKIKAFVLAHKIISGIVIFLVVLGGYFLLKSGNTEPPRYVTAKVEVGTIISSVSGSGQVEAESLVELKARTTDTIVYVGAKPGDFVKKGKTLISLNSKDAQKSVRDAETNLEIAKLELEQFIAPPETVDVLEIKKAITDAELSKKEAEEDVRDAYRDLLNSSIVAVATDGSTSTAPTITGTYIKDTEAVITISVYQTGAGAYFNVNSLPSGVVSGSGRVSTSVYEPVGDSGLYVKFASTTVPQPAWEIRLPNKTVVAYETNLVSYQTALSEQKKTNDSADLTILQKNQALADLYQPDELTLKSKQLGVRKAEDALANAKADLSDYYVSAPFDGVIASMDAKVGDSASGVLGTIVTNQKVATLSMNEVDVSKINLGQKATVTFDAIEDLSVTGTVAQIDTVGTVNQGVVSYNVKVAFDTDDERIKPGMSVTASIIIESKVDVLMVPTSSVKSQNGVSYVQMFETPLPPPLAGEVGTISNTPPKQVPVEIGITDDLNTEIISGLKSGDQVVSKVITASTTTTTQAPSLFGGGGVRTGGLGR